MLQSIKRPGYHIERSWQEILQDWARSLPGGRDGKTRLALRESYSLTLSTLEPDVLVGPTWGVVDDLAITMTGKPEVTSSHTLDIIWMHDLFNKFPFTKTGPCNLSTPINYQVCTNLSGLPVKITRTPLFITFQSAQNFKKFNRTGEVMTKSWSEASQLCEAAGALLPRICSRRELHDLIEILRKYLFLDYVTESVFIGVDLKVSCILPHVSGSIQTMLTTCNKNLLCFVQDANKWQDGSPTAYQLWRPSRKLAYSFDVMSQRETDGENLQIMASNNQVQNETFHPSRRHKCTALSLIDLAMPTWYTMKCDQKLFSTVVCSKHFAPKSSERNRQVMKLFCPSHQHVRKDRSCLSFYWIKSHMFAKQHCHPAVKKNIFIFHAITVNQTLPLLNAGNTSLIVERYFNKIYITTVKQQYLSQGLCIKQSSAQKFRAHGNIFPCKQWVYISAVFVCDGTRDCPGDDIQCVCKPTEKTLPKMCKSFEIDSKHPVCGPLYNQTSKGTCQVFTESWANEKSKSPQTNETFSFCKVEDLKFPCKHNDLLQCFHISHICRYNKHSADSTKVLAKCRHGEHMRECENFQCNMMFKCPGFYCIPWSYVCDREWDCPSGLDESINMLCGHNRSCSGLFKCRKSQICIHLGDVCDGVGDCPTNDDEFLCTLKFAHCPFSCSCLTFAVLCMNRTVLNGQEREFFPFTVVFILKSEVKASLNFSNCKYVYLSDCTLKYFCILLSTCNTLQILSSVSTNISFLTSGCFTKCHHIKIIDISRNLLSQVPPALFSNLLFLTFVNLSSNFIHEIQPNVFSNLPELSILSFLRMNVSAAQHQVFAKLSLKFLETDNYLMCCLASPGAKCSSSVPWHFSCTDLLGSTGLNVVMPTISFFIFFSNTISVVFQRESFLINYQKGVEKTGAFGVTVGLVNFSDFLCAVPLFLLWAFSQAHEGIFVLVANKWKSSGGCYSIFCLFLAFSLLSPCVLSIFSLSRLQIVACPIDTQFKETNFVLKCCLPFVCLSVSLALLLTMLTWLVDCKLLSSEISTVICFPFVDPSHKMILVWINTLLAVSCQVAALVFIIVVHIKLIISLKASQARIAASVSKTQHSNTALAAQLITITSTNLLCWIPGSVNCLTSLLLEKYPMQLIFWTAAIIYPFNSIVNPVVFIVTTIRKMLK